MIKHTDKECFLFSGPLWFGEQGTFKPLHCNVDEYDSGDRA